MADDPKQIKDPAQNAQEAAVEASEGAASPPKKIEKGIQEIDRAYKERAALDKAKKLGVKIIDETEFIKMIGNA